MIERVSLPEGRVPTAIWPLKAPRETQVPLVVVPLPPGQEKGTESPDQVMTMLSRPGVPHWVEGAPKPLEPGVLG